MNKRIVLGKVDKEMDQPSQLQLDRVRDPVAVLGHTLDELNMDFRIVDLDRQTPEVSEQAAILLREAFRDRTEDWQDIESARQEVVESLVPERISRVAINSSGKVLGWIGAIPMYRGRVWEIHPLVVAESHRRQGIGRALISDLERVVVKHGGVTLWLGSDDENGETSLSGIDLYSNIPDVIRCFTKIRGEHPCDFYLRVGFQISGVLPDANGPGRPDIFFAKRVGRSQDTDSGAPGDAEHNGLSG